MNLPTSRVALVLSCAALLVAAAARARAEPFEPDVDASYVRSGAFATFAASLVEGVQIDAVRSVDVDGDGAIARSDGIPRRAHRRSRVGRAAVPARAATLAR